MPTKIIYNIIILRGRSNYFISKHLADISVFLESIIGMGQTEIQAYHQPHDAPTRVKPNFVADTQVLSLHR